MRITESDKDTAHNIIYILYSNKGYNKFTQVFFTSQGEIKKVCCNVMFDTIEEIDTVKQQIDSVIVRKSCNCFP